MGWLWATPSPPKTPTPTTDNATNVSKTAAPASTETASSDVDPEIQKFLDLFKAEKEPEPTAPEQSTKAEIQPTASSSWFTLKSSATSPSQVETRNAAAPAPELDPVAESLLPQDTVDRLDGGAEEILAELLETGTSDRGVEVDTLVQRVNLDGGLGGGRECTLGTLASSAETAESTSVGGQVLLVLALELVDEVVDETVVEVLATQRRRSRAIYLDLEDTVLNGQERHIEGTTTEIEDEDVALTLDLLVETVSDGSSSGLVDDTEDVETGDETGVLGSLTLRVVEVGRDSDDCA
ncbi:hypothetical protein BN1723_002635 [Verticillium longisporum]|uniref:Uncharacterized protein n=1 Tax=Verticillium longisporum TaxID=100787 RepID=A0A0G4LF42_VERLO|nr:hypothetical protein BN1723_002635 [Verticillium longisporum]